jgi:hypothetical protein
MGYICVRGRAEKGHLLALQEVNGQIVVDYLE